ncbi:hypothetical protein BCU85_12695 [Vibrio lentus]|uniref:hypothetical protein n=1 Tax=Vibrio lentus TaxID=136468 RepID=UPI000C81F481|nr:hypothetical protein [Vibrio lentus]MCC4815995.1 hypothetical protein [Vibrio lentus]PMG67798.1 hypothetical protein BCU85_12695 [Vibrio lentus]PMK86534.1 hypothetical protein BCT88_13145 [Vibrio lentus]PML21088.1 hypothetical protein BCT80_14635 [Vibrio lentus]PMM23805.1 hypothetical protein BCT57_07350 [Vibrio lentus]
MKLKLLSTLIAASFLAGCSSSGSSNSGGGTEPGPGPSPQDGIADVNYHQGNEFDAALITGDAGDYNALVIRDQSNINGETTTHILVDGNIYSVSGGLVSDTQGNEIGYIENQGDQVVFNGVIKGEKVEVTLTVVDGRLIADSTVIETPPKWGDEGATSISIVEEGENKLIYVGDELIGYVDAKNIIIKDGEPIGRFEGDMKNGDIFFHDGSTVNFQTYDDNSQTIVTIHKDGMIYKWNSATGERTVSIDESTDHDWGNTDPDFGNGKLVKTVYRADYRGGEVIYAKGYNDGELVILLNVDGKKFQIAANDQLKANIGDVVNDRIGNIDPGFDLDKEPRELREKIQSLSQEQRQQIKQAVKDRVSRS